MYQPLPLISVIIPVFNDTERLQACLAALAGQTYPQDRFEVIVVDNGSAAPPRELVESFAFCRYAEEPRPGSYAARNRGLELAQGQVFAFTDSDCIPAPDWLAVGQRELARHPSCGFVGGHIEVFPQDSRPTAVELYDLVFGLRQDTYLDELNFAATANMMTRREVMQHVGRFDAELNSGGDQEWGQRATELGFAGVYAPAAVVRHPARRRAPEIFRQKRRHAGGRFDSHRNNPYRYFSWHFWQTFLRRVTPKVGRMCEARRVLKQRGYGLLDAIRVSFVILAVQYVTMFEFLRLWLGSSSERR